MACHALYGIATCFGHTGVTLMLKIISLILIDFEVILRPTETVF